MTSLAFKFVRTSLLCISTISAIFMLKAVEAVVFAESRFLRHTVLLYLARSSRLALAAAAEFHFLWNFLTFVSISHVF